MHSQVLIWSIAHIYVQTSSVKCVYYRCKIQEWSSTSIDLVPLVITSSFMYVHSDIFVDGIHII